MTIRTFLLLFRTVVKTPPDGKERPDFRNLTNTVPQQPQRGIGPNRRPGPNRGPGGNRPPQRN